MAHFTNRSVLITINAERERFHTHTQREGDIKREENSSLSECANPVWYKTLQDI